MKLKYEKPISNFAFNCNLRHYIVEARVAVNCAGGVGRELGHVVVAWDEVESKVSKRFLMF